VERPGWWRKEREVGNQGVEECGGEWVLGSKSIADREASAICMLGKSRRCPSMGRGVHQAKAGLVRGRIGGVEREDLPESATVKI